MAIEVRLLIEVDKHEDWWKTKGFDYSDFTSIITIKASFGEF